MKEGLEALTERPQSVPEQNWGGPYMAWRHDGPLDFWGNRIVYRASSDGSTFLVMCLGPDGLVNTEDDIYPPDATVRKVSF